MSGIATSELRQPLPAAPSPAPVPAPTPAIGRGRWLRDAAAAFWLGLLFRTVGSAPSFSRLLKPLAVAAAWRSSRAIRSATAANARRIFGPDVSPAAADAFGRDVVSNFYDFVADVGLALRLSKEQLAQRIESIEGDEHYIAARAVGKGAIIATAHMGSFEAGAAALLGREKAMHVVFKRDATYFERVRSSLRAKLGVIEAPVDDGWPMWLRLREALLRDEVVMLQADRIMPGQKGCRVPFLHGHLMLPTGPIKLALASGAPVVPIFAIRAASGRIRIHVEPQIVVEPSEEEPHPALLRFAATLEKFVRTYPGQWLLFHKGFCEDAT